MIRVTSDVLGRRLQRRRAVQGQASLAAAEHVGIAIADAVASTTGQRCQSRSNRDIAPALETVLDAAVGVSRVLPQAPGAADGRVQGREGGRRPHKQPAAGITIREAARVYIVGHGRRVLLTPLRGR